MAPGLNGGIGSKCKLVGMLGVDESTLKTVLASWGPGRFDAEVFLDGKGLRPDGKTAATLIPPAFGLAGVNLHTFEGWGSVTYWNGPRPLGTPGEIGIDDFQANRSPDKRYRTTPLRGLFAHSKGGFYHDGRFPTLLDVVNHYDSFKALGLTDEEKRDLVEYLKSL